MNEVNVHSSYSSVVSEGQWDTISDNLVRCSLLKLLSLMLMGENMSTWTFGSLFDVHFQNMTLNINYLSQSGLTSESSHKHSVDRTRGDTWPPLQYYKEETHGDRGKSTCHLHRDFSRLLN